MEFQRRPPRKEKPISEINPDEDTQVAIMGTVVDKNEQAAVLDDGSGDVHVVLEEVQNVELNDFIRVIGRVFPTENGFEVRAEILQKAGGMDMALYKEVKKIENKLDW